MARIVARTVVGSDPVLMLDAPIQATKKVLGMANLTLADMDVIEINEAFASVVLAWEKEFKPDMARVNPNGGAIAHGHPVGATGAILMTKLVYELQRRGARYGLQTMCIGHGMATATIIERINPGGDASAKGLQQSFGVMVNYLYDLDELEQNVESFAREGAIAMSAAIRRLARQK